MPPTLARVDEHVAVEVDAGRLDVHRRHARDVARDGERLVERDVVGGDRDGDRAVGEADERRPWSTPAGATVRVVTAPVRGSVTANAMGWLPAVLARVTVTSPLPVDAHRAGRHLRACRGCRTPTVSVWSAALPSAVTGMVSGAVGEAGQRRPTSVAPGASTRWRRRWCGDR